MCEFLNFQVDMQCLKKKGGCNSGEGMGDITREECRTGVVDHRGFGGEGVDHGLDKVEEHGLGEVEQHGLDKVEEHGLGKVVADNFSGEVADTLGQLIEEHDYTNTITWINRGKAEKGGEAENEMQEKVEYGESGYKLESENEAPNTREDVKKMEVALDSGAESRENGVVVWVKEEMGPDLKKEVVQPRQ